MKTRASFTRLTPPSIRPEPCGELAILTVAGAGILVGALALVAALTGRSPSPATWYLTRAAGLTLYLLLWLATLLGLGLTTTLLDRFGGRAVVYSAHRFVTELAYGFLALHLLTLAADQAVVFGLKALLVPFAAPTSEPWTGFGVLAAQLMVLVGVSFGLRRWIGHRGWRLLHALAFPMFGLGLAHGIGAGSDSNALWVQIIYLTTGLSVVWLTIYRLARWPSRGRTEPSAPRRPMDRLAASPTVPTRTTVASAKR